MASAGPGVLPILICSVRLAADCYCCCRAATDLLLCMVAEVGRLATAAESRSHFGIWSIISAPLVSAQQLLSFVIWKATRMNRLQRPCSPLNR